MMEKRIGIGPEADRLIDHQRPFRGFLALRALGQNAIFLL
jgi:hypothetical protein